MSKIRVLVADDHAIFRFGLRKLIDQQRDMQVIAEAANGHEALRAYSELRPDVTVMDLRMPGLDGAATITALLQQEATARVLVLTAYDGDEDVQRAMRAGAWGCLPKDAFAAEMLGAIREVHAGEKLLPAATLPERAQRRNLWPRERAVIELVAKGLSNKEICAALSIAEGTLRNHLRRLFEKLGVDDRTQAAMEAVKRGIIRPP